MRLLSARVLAALFVNKPISFSTWAILMSLKRSRLSAFCQLTTLNRIDLITMGLVVCGIKRANVILYNKVYLCVVGRPSFGIRLRLSCWLKIKHRWKLCVSYFVLWLELRALALVRAWLITGRKHQLRRQLSLLNVWVGKCSWVLHSFFVKCAHADINVSVCAFVL
ncbi:hypothetical protein AADW59_00500 [Candidatus Hodgkinia cicadicola]